MNIKEVYAHHSPGDGVDVRLLTDSYTECIGDLFPKKTGASRNFYPFGVFHLKSYGTFYRRSEKANSVSRWWAAELLHDAHRYLAYPSHRVTDLGKFFFWVMA